MSPRLFKYAFSFFYLAFCASSANADEGGFAKACGFLFERSAHVVTAPLRGLERTYHRLQVQKHWNRFNWEKYEIAVADLRADRVVEGPADAFEIELAYLEVGIERSVKSDRPLSIEAIARGSDWNKKFGLYKILRGSTRNPVALAWEGLSFSVQRARPVATAKGITEWQARKIMREVYLLHSVPMGKDAAVLDLFRSRTAEAARKLLDHRIDFEISSRGFRHYLDSKAGIRSAIVQDRIERFLATDAGSVLITTLSNFGITHGYVGHLPTYTRLEITPDLITRLWRDGDSALTKAERALLARDSAAQVKINAVRKGLTTVAAIISTYALYADIRETLVLEDEKKAQEIIDALNETNQTIRRRLDACEPLDSHSRIVLRWMWDYQDQHGHLPTSDNLDFQSVKSHHWKKDSETRFAALPASLKKAGYGSNEIEQMLKALAPVTGRPLPASD